MAQIQRVIPKIYFCALIVQHKFVRAVIDFGFSNSEVHTRPVHLDGPCAAHQQQVQVLLAARHPFAVQILIVYLHTRLAAVRRHRAAVGLLVQVPLQQLLHGFGQFQVRGAFTSPQQLLQVFRLLQYIAACVRFKQL